LLCRAFLYQSNTVYILKKKNEDRFYIGSVVESCLITRFRKHVCFHASSSFDLYRIIQVQNHVVFNAAVIEAALHTHIAYKLGRSFKSIASCGKNGFDCDAVVLDNSVSCVLAQSFCDGIVMVVNHEWVCAFNQLSLIFGADIFLSVTGTESESERAKRNAKQQAYWGSLSEAKREKFKAKNREYQRKRRAKMREEYLVEESEL
jgi:hypothetical protein